MKKTFVMAIILSIGLSSFLYSIENKNIISPFAGIVVLFPGPNISPTIGIGYERNIYKGLYAGIKLGYPLVANIVLDYYVNNETSINIDIGILTGIGFTFLRHHNIFVEAFPKMDVPSQGYILPINICYAYKIYF